MDTHESVRETLDAFGTLGARKTVHLRKRNALILLVIGVAVLVFAGAIVVTFKGPDVMPALLIAALFATLGATCAGAGAVRRGDGVAVMERGLLTWHGIRCQEIPWTSILNVRQAIVKHSSQGLPHYTTFRLTLRLADGRKQMFDGSYSDIRCLVRQVQDAVTPLRLDDALATVQAGGVADFGAIGVSESGLRFIRAKIPWEQVGRVAIERGLLYVKRKDRMLTGIPCEVSRIDNLYACLGAVASHVPVEGLDGARNLLL